MVCRRDIAMWKAGHDNYSTIGNVNRREAEEAELQDDRPDAG